MKFIFSLFLLSFIGTAGRSQIVSIQNTFQPNILYLGLNNPLKVAVEGIPSGSVSLTTDNGIIDGDHGHYYINPDHLGLAIIKVKRKTTNGVKVIDSIFYSVRLITTSISVSGKTGGEITKAALCVQIAPSANIEAGGALCGRFAIDSFTISVMRQGNEIYKKSIGNPDGARIDTTTSAFFKTLKNNDKVIFSSMRIKYPDKKTFFSPDKMEFTVIEAEKCSTDLNIYYNTPIIDPITGEERKPAKN